MSEHMGSAAEGNIGLPSSQGIRASTSIPSEAGIPPRLYEEYAYVLDFLQYGRPVADKSRHLALPTVQVIGETYFTLLEAEVRSGAPVSLHERVYIGKDRREKINRIMGRIGYNDLTANAKAEVLSVLEELIGNQEQRFVAFFNNSQAITPYACIGIAPWNRKEINVANNQRPREESLRQLQRPAGPNEYRRSNQSDRKENSG